MSAQMLSQMYLCQAQNGVMLMSAEVLVLHLCSIFIVSLSIVKYCDFNVFKSCCVLQVWGRAGQRRPQGSYLQQAIQWIESQAL